MAASMISLAMALALSASGGVHPYHRIANVTPPGPGLGWGFPNGMPDGYGWWDPGMTLPLGSDRTPEYFFRRYYAVPASQMFMPTYFNAYVSRGQRYIPYAGCGGKHPMGGPPTGPAALPVLPLTESGAANRGTAPVPSYSGRTEATPINPGGTGLTP